MLPPGLFVGLIRMRALAGHMDHKRVRALAFNCVVTGIFKPKKPGFVLIQGKREGILAYISGLKSLRLQQILSKVCTLPHIAPLADEPHALGSNPAGPRSLPDARPPGVRTQGLTSVKNTSDLLQALDRLGLRSWGEEMVNQSEAPPTSLPTPRNSPFREARASKASQRD